MFLQCFGLCVIEKVKEVIVFIVFRFTVHEQTQMAISAGVPTDHTAFTLESDMSGLWVKNGPTVLDFCYSWVW